MKYKYLKQFDTLEKGDEYHHRWKLWFPVDPEDVGKQKRRVFSHKTRVRRKEK